MSRVTQLVEHIPEPLSPEQEVALRECIQRDIDFAKRMPKIGLLNWLIKSRLQWYRIDDPTCECPETLNDKSLRNIKRSSVRLPANDESLYTLDRLLKSFAREGQCKVNSLVIVRGVANSKAIVFSVQARFMP